MWLLIGFTLIVFIHSKLVPRCSAHMYGNNLGTSSRLTKYFIDIRQYVFDIIDSPLIESHNTIMCNLKISF